MAKDNTAQFRDFYTKAKKILLLLPENPSLDALSAAFAFAHAGTKEGKVMSLAFSDPHHKKETLSFLDAPQNILHSLFGMRDFILSFSTKHNPISNVRTEKNIDRLDIFITPERGAIDPRDFSFSPARFGHDLVITLGLTERNGIGVLHEQCPDIFFEVPIINVDNDTKNDNFGQINIVDVTASSVCEISMHLIESINSALIDQPIADCLLTGIIAATDSFQNRRATPTAMRRASELIDKGARQQEIVQHLYKRQSLSLLKLWGRIMSRMVWNEKERLVYASVSQKDFHDTHTTSTDLPKILAKIKANYALGKIFFILYEDAPHSVRGIIDFARIGDRTTLADKLGAHPENDTYAFETEDSTLETAVKTILTKLS